MCKSIFQMSNVSTLQQEGEPPRKRLRRTIRSCLECKRRKVRCQLSSEDVKVCSGCSSRGIVCEAPGPETVDHDQAAKSVLDRLTRVESLLDNLMNTKPRDSSSECSDNFRMHDMSESPAKLQSPYPFVDVSITEKPPILSLFENGTFSREQGGPSSSYAYEAQALSPSTSYAKSWPLKLEKIRHRLLMLLPSQEDVDLIRASTNGWQVVEVLCMEKGDVQDPLSSSNMSTASQQHPAAIARTVLYLLICLQQLPPEFDVSRLNIGPSLEKILDKYLSAVSSLISSDNEYVSSVEGLECLLLQSFYYINAGSIRRAFVSCRRALTIAQLLGVQREFIQLINLTTSANITERQMMWHKLVMTDRYLSVLLGLPAGTDNGCFGNIDEVFQENLYNHRIFERRLCIVAGEITIRSQNPTNDTYSSTQLIDESMEKLVKEIPPSSWIIPSFITLERCPEAATQFNRLLSQIWFFQLKIILHLPFMHRAATEPQYEYSKYSCLSASREIIQRYLALRKANNTQLHCRVVDFGTFIASTILILDQIAPQRDYVTANIVRDRDNDRALIQDTITSMEVVARGSRETVAKQSVEVMKTLLTTSINDRQRAIRLKIPYFGTITINRSHPVSTSETFSSPSDVLPRTQQGQTGARMHDNTAHAHASSDMPEEASMITFESNTNFLSMGDPLVAGYDFGGVDNWLFSSLITDDLGEFGMP